MKNFRIDLLEHLLPAFPESLEITDFVLDCHRDGIGNFQMKEEFQALLEKDFIRVRVESIETGDYRMLFTLARNSPIDGVVIARLTPEGKEFLEDYNRKRQPPPTPVTNVYGDTIVMGTNSGVFVHRSDNNIVSQGKQSKNKKPWYKRTIFLYFVFPIIAAVIGYFVWHYISKGLNFK